MKKYFYLLLSLAVLATACDNDSEPIDPNRNSQNQNDNNKPGEKDNPDLPSKGDSEDPVVLPHYILHFQQLENFAATYDHKYHTLSVNGCGKLVSYDDDDPSKFEALCEDRGDKGYDKPRKLPNMPGIVDYTYLTDDIATIDLVADREWNGIAPGESWNGFCWLKTASARRHIESGYTYVYDWTEIPTYFTENASRHFQYYCPELEPISKPLTECTAEDLMLIGLPEEMDLLQLYLSDGPFKIEDYRFTIRITTASGKVFDTPVEMR